MENRMPLLLSASQKRWIGKEGQVLPAHVYQGIEGFLGGVLWVELGRFGGEIVDCYHLSHGCHVGLLDFEGIRGMVDN
jgi:hypothetical protein